MKLRQAATLIALAGWAAAAADDFDALSLAALRDAAPTKYSAQPQLPLGDLAGAPRALADAPQSALLVAKTSEGNWCKLRVRVGGRKGPDGAAVPAVVVERLTTFSADPRKGVLADRRDLLLFPGFALDLDLGQIVPEALGADLKFAAPTAVSALPAAPAAKGAMPAMPGAEAKLGLAGQRLTAVNGAALFLAKEPLAAAAAAPPKAGFAGSFTLDAAGRWKGVLTLQPAVAGKVSGTFRSADTQAEYPVAGELKRPGKRVLLRIAFPRSDLELEGHLWSDEAQFAGVARLQEQEFGFVARRDR